MTGSAPINATAAAAAARESTPGRIAPRSRHANQARPGTIRIIEVPEQEPDANGKAAQDPRGERRATETLAGVRAPRCQNRQRPARDIRRVDRHEKRGQLKGRHQREEKTAAIAADAGDGCGAHLAARLATIAEVAANERAAGSRTLHSLTPKSVVLPRISQAMPGPLL